MNEAFTDNSAKAPGRNDPCPCGSGKKYKKCCMGNDQAEPKYNFEALSTEAIYQFENENFEIAESISKTMLEKNPTNSVANQILGLINFRTGDYPSANSFLTKALKKDPQNALVHNSLAKVLENQNKFDEAAVHANKAIRLGEGIADPFNTLGNILIKKGEYSDALHQFKKAIEIEPDVQDYQLNYSVGLMHMGYIAEARSGLNDLIDSYPTFIPAYINIAAVCREQKNYNEAIEYLKSAISIDPYNSELHNNLGTMYAETGNNKREIECYYEALRLNPNLSSVYTNLFELLRDEGELLKLHQLADTIISNSTQQKLFPLAVGAFSVSGDFDARDNTLKKIEELMHDDASICFDIEPTLMLSCYVDDKTSKQIFDLHKCWGNAIESKARAYTHDSRKRASLKNKKIRVGYISPDFRAHPVGFFIKNILKEADVNNYEVYCYSNHEKEDGLTSEIRNSVTEFTKITKLAHKEIARQIYDDKIDILVDLAGHTFRSSVAVLACRPAPIQMTYLGYPNTTGLKAVNYRITDKYADVEDGTIYTEKKLEMPECFLTIGVLPEISIESNSLIGSEVLTFGSFNNIQKLNRSVVRLWAKILNELPSARLMLKAAELESGFTRENIVKLFREYSVNEDRLVIRGKTSSMEEHLKMYNEVDIAVDPFPYSGTTTTCEALWMGTPVITLVGKQHQQRVSYSILKNIGAEELAAFTEEQYISVARNLALDIQRLKEYKKNLRGMMQQSILCDAGRFTKQLEDLYRKVWQDYCAK